MDAAAPPPQQVAHEAGELFALKLEEITTDEFKVIPLDTAGQPVRDAEGEISSHFAWQLGHDANQIDSIRTAMRRGVADDQTSAAVVAFGQRLYGFLFGGKVGPEFERRRKVAQRLYIQVYLPAALDDVPWEYLCEPDLPGAPRFLLLDRKLSLSRGNEPGFSATPLAELERPLRLLVVVSSPPDLPESRKLDTLRELRLIRNAVAPLVAAGQLALRELDEPSPGNIAAAMRWQPHVVHFTGHGDYNREQGGLLLIEDGNDKSLAANAQQVASYFATASVRLIVLSACRSGESSAAARRALPGIGAALVDGGAPAVVAMQDSIRDDHASVWAAGFYNSLVDSWSVAEAMADARVILHAQQAGDWGLPVLLTEQPVSALFRFRQDSPPATPPPHGVDNVLLNNPHDLFVGRQLEQRRLVDGLLGDQMAIGIITGPGGIGKSSLAYRLYERTHDNFWAALSIDCSTKPSTEQILALIGEWLRQNGDTSFSPILANDKLSPEQKLPNLVQALERSAERYLLVFDNFETLLEERADGTFVPEEVLLGKLLAAFVRGLKHSKLLITCRYRFKFDELPGNVEWISLYDLTLNETTSLMGQQPRLGALGTYADYAKLWNAGVRNPRLIEYVEGLLGDEDISYIMADLQEVKEDLLENQLLDRLYEHLAADAQAMLRRSSVYRLAVPLEFLERQLSDAVTGSKRTRLRSLLDRSLINKVDLATGDGTEARYRLHESTRQWAEQLLTSSEGTDGLREAQLRGAKAHEDWEANTNTLDDRLEARRLYFAAEDYKRAGELVVSMTELLLRWGYYDLCGSLLQETIDQSDPTGDLHAVAMQNLGVLRQNQGDYDAARRLYNESLEIARRLGNLNGVASILHQFGRLAQDQGNYDEALRLYNESLETLRQVGNHSGVASSLHHLGMLAQTQGNYDEARRLYNESLEIKRQVGNRSGVASSLSQLGILEQLQGNNAEAQRLQNESLKVRRETGDLAGIAICLHQLGRLAQDQGNYDEARRLYNESLEIARRLGDLSGVSNTLHQLGILAQVQGNYDDARRLYNESLEIARRLGDLSGVAISLGQLGILAQVQGNYDEARRLYNESLEIERRLGNLSGVATTLGALGTLAEKENSLLEAERLQRESLEIRMRIGDVAGAARNLGNLGVLEERQGNFREALRYMLSAYNTFDRLGSPNKNIAGRALARIRDQIGEEQFNAYLQELQEEQEKQDE